MLRVATLNLLHSPDAIRERVDHLITELVTEDLDFLLLQEVMPEDADGYFAPAHLAIALGMRHLVFTYDDTRSGGNAVLSKHPLTPVFGPQDVPFPDLAPAIAETYVDGRRVIAMSYHGAWGPQATAARLAQLRILDGIAREEFARGGAHLNRETRPVIILGGDFNAVPDSAPYRFITGLDHVLGHSTTWLDATDGISHTSGFDSALSTATATSMPGAGYRPERQPKRRIDYLFVFEWAYGQAGEPVSARRIADSTFTAVDGRELTVSDHYGVMAELWMPAAQVS